jgi:hypothetical protein
MRRVLSVLGRTVWALLALGLTGAVVVAGAFDPAPEPAAVPPVQVDVPAPATTLVCPGPVRLPTELDEGDDVAYDPQFDTTPVASTAAVVGVTARPEDAQAAEVTVRSLGFADDAARAVAGEPATVLDPLTALVLHADAVDDVPAWAAGALHVSTTAGDLRGTVAASCQAPSAETWLVGGSTELGSSSRLVLQNAGATPALVTVRLWGASGPVELAGVPQYLVPAGSERVVLLEGVAAEQERIVVQTLAEGGLVTAYVQDSRLRGLVPAGVDDVVAGQAPALQQVVPGLSLAGPTAADIPVLRVLAPGEEGGTVDVVLLGADGPVDLPGGHTEIDAGEVLDIPLGSVPAGSYAAVVTADVPVVAGAMLTRTGTADPSDEPPSELAWAPSVAVGRAGPLALPADMPGQLLLSLVPSDDRAGPAVVTLEVITDEGTTVLERRVPDGSTVALDLAELTDAGLAGVTVRSDDPRLAWAAVLDDDAMVSVLAPVAPRDPQARVSVRVR